MTGAKLTRRQSGGATLSDRLHRKGRTTNKAGRSLTAADRLNKSGPAH